MKNAKIHIAEIKETYSFIVMVLRRTECFEYYVRDKKGWFPFEYMFGVMSHSDELIKSAINQFIELHKDEL